MPRWITTEAGKKIDLDWFDADKSISDSLRDYYKTLSIKPLQIDFRQELYVKNQIRQTGRKYKGETISLIVLPGSPYMMYIFSHGSGRIETTRITIIDAINHDELEIMEDYFDRRL